MILYVGETLWKIWVNFYCAQCQLLEPLFHIFALFKFKFHFSLRKSSINVRFWNYLKVLLHYTQSKHQANSPKLLGPMTTLQMLWIQFTIMPHWMLPTIINLVKAGYLYQWNPKPFSHLRDQNMMKLVTTSNGYKLRQYTHIVEDDIQQPTSI